MPTISRLESDFKELNQLYYSLGKFEEKLLKHIQCSDKENYNLELADRIKKRINEISENINIIETNWFG